MRPEAYIALAGGLLLWVWVLSLLALDIVGWFQAARDRREHGRLLDELWDDGDAQAADDELARSC